MGIVLHAIVKDLGTPPTRILHDISLRVPEGELVAITGRSGSGKTSLMYIMSTLDRPTGGRVEIDGTSMGELSERALHGFRNRRMGFVFQFHHLLPELTALENVLLPARKAGEIARHTESAKKLLARVGLGDKTHRRPRELSGGEQQRVAIARALAMRPQYLFADEPTGNLDSTNGDIIMQILREICAEDGTTVIYVTHDLDYAATATTQIHLSDGRLVDDAVAQHRS